MEYRSLGKSGLKVSALSFGSWVTFGHQIDKKVAASLLTLAYESGINFFDNAEVYAHGKSEEVMGTILKEKKWDRTSYILSSKAFFGSRGADTLPTQRGLSRKHLVEACHEALSRLQVDYLDLFYCHRPDKETPIEEVVWTMNILINQGKILYWGTSEWSSEAIMEAFVFAEKNRLIPPTMEQPEYNLLHRQKMECDYLNIFKNFGYGTTIWSPLASGLLTGKYNMQNIHEGRLFLEGYEWLKNKTLLQEKLQKVASFVSYAQAFGVSPAQLAIAWVLKNQNVSTAILGASRAEQLKENLKALELSYQLDMEAMKKLDDIFGTKPVLPEF